MRSSCPATLAAIAITLSITPAMAQSADCLTEAEARSVVAYALPAAIEATAARCRPALPASAWLNRGAAGMAARYRRDGGGNPAAALAVIEKLSGQSVPDMLDPSTLTTVVEQLIADRIGTAVATRDCTAISRIAEQISPLPIGNVASLLVALVQLDRGTASRTGIRICPTAGAR
ncbi:hypothetical protein [Sphingomonas montana]|uniref:hypothetical protein n=1 Tax=Sphingomonas montana TaxID=1843236 RepID=UPI00101AD1FF|nr:hypothetical protein [Sphingomonas montana]